MSGTSSESLDSAFHENRRLLWNLAYRLTGNTADADDVLQETFLRAIRRPPEDKDRSWRPWLVRVALNLGKDLLRRRRRSGYPGTWLPSPVETEALLWDPVDEAGHPGQRYDLVESASFAFLLALEVLSPMQRGVLLLRDVFDYSSRDAAEALGITEANARKLHSRARIALASYDATRQPISAARQSETRHVLERFLNCVAAGDMETLETILAKDARALSDGGGEFVSSTIPVVGSQRVAKLFLGLARKSAPPLHIEILMLNGLPAVFVERVAPAGVAPRFTLQVEIDETGRLARTYLVMSTRKLAAVRFSKRRSEGAP